MLYAKYLKGRKRKIKKSLLNRPRSSCQARRTKTIYLPLMKITKVFLRPLSPVQSLYINHARFMLLPWFLLFPFFLSLHFIVGISVNLSLPVLQYWNDQVYLMSHTFPSNSQFTWETGLSVVAWSFCSAPNVHGLDFMMKLTEKSLAGLVLFLENKMLCKLHPTVATCSLYGVSAPQLCSCQSWWHCRISWWN